MSRVRSSLGVETRNMYGTSELGSVAVSCGNHRSMHVIESLFEVEIFRGGQSVEDGKVGEVVITDLTNLAMPLIRYKVDDVGRRLMAYEESRLTVARWIRGLENEVVFTRNTTEALNLTASVSDAGLLGPSMDFGQGVAMAVIAAIARSPSFCDERPGSIPRITPAGFVQRGLCNGGRSGDATREQGRFDTDGRSDSDCGILGRWGRGFHAAWSLESSLRWHSLSVRWSRGAQSRLFDRCIGA